MTDLMKRYTEFNDRLRAAGKTLLAFPCPRCDQTIETQAAPADDKWDSLSNCPHCEGLYFKVVTSEQAYGEVPSSLSNLKVTQQ